MRKDIIVEEVHLTAALVLAERLDDFDILGAVRARLEAITSLVHADSENLTDTDFS